MTQRKDETREEYLARKCEKARIKHSLSPEKHRLSSSEYYYSNTERVKQKFKEYRLKNKDKLNAMSREYHKAHKEQIKVYRKERRQTMRLKILEHYGMKCSCCGESRIEFLSIDHINGNGNEHRRQIGGSSELYYWLIQNNFPDGFQILCYNCNLSKGFYGYCPHQTQPNH